MTDSSPSRRTARDLISMFDPNWNADRAEPRRRRSPARYLAPVALVAVIVGTYVVVEQGVNNNKPATALSKPRAHLTRPQRHYLHHRFYTVQANDSLTRIAAKTGISVARLQTLNPRIDPNALQPGQRLRLRR